MAFSVLDVARAECGAAVPGDLSVVGYDDVPMASWAAYSLTTVRQPVNQMVEATVEMLLGMIDGDAAQQIKIDGPLILRGSARVPEGWT